MLNSLADIPLPHTYADRQVKLKQWGFECSCSLCSLPEAERNISDTRRMLIAGIQENMLEALDQHDLRRAAKFVEASMKIIHDEDLTKTSAEVHESLARIYWALGDRNLARHWARKCIDLRCDWDLLEPANRTQKLMDLMSTFEVF